MNTIRTSLTLTAGAALAIGLGGCASAPAAATTHDDLVLVIGARNGSPQVTGAELGALLESALDAEGDRVTIVVVDGSPHVAYTAELSELPGNGSDRADDIHDTIEDVKTFATSARADDPEADVVEAIALGASTFRDGTRRTLALFDSGLQTTGDVDLTEGRLYAGTDMLLENTEASNTIADLTGVAVVAPRLGVTVQPQQPVNEDARRTLTELWTSFFAAAHAASVDLEPSGAVALPQNDADLPPVTPVEIRRPKPVALDCAQLLTANTIGFEAGSAELTDPDAARAVIEAVHAALAGCPGDYRVDASASSEGDAEANRVLTDARGATVAALVEEVSGQKVAEVVGWGETWPCRVPDVDANGRLDIDAAIANRTVAVSKGAPAC